MEKGSGQTKKYEPLENVHQVMKNILPTDCTIDDDALELMKKCVAEFISSVGCEAVSKSVNDSKNSVSSLEVLTSLHNIGFDEYVEPMQLYIARTKIRPPVLSLIGQEYAAEKAKKLKKSHVKPETTTPSVPTQLPKSKVLPLKTSLLSHSLNESSSSTSPTNIAMNCVNGGDSDGKTQSAMSLDASSPISGANLHDPLIIQRLNMALGMARDNRDNPRCDLPLLASQVPVSFKFFMDRLESTNRAADSEVGGAV
jgi:hypothetical protein